jgi:hypothetical protein
MSIFRAIGRETGFLHRRQLMNGFPRSTWRALPWINQGTGPVGNGRELSRLWIGIHPAVLLSVLVHGCATGVFSSRKL